MTDEVELIRQVNAAVASGDIEAVSQTMHPDVVWEHNIGRGTPEEGVYRGRADVTRLLARIIEPWAYLRPEPSHIDDLGDGKYRIRGELHAKHSETATEILSPYEQVLEVRDGLLVKGSMTSSTGV